MTTQDSTPQEAPRVFVTAKEAQGKPRTERTDEQIRADMKDSVRRNISALQTLAKL